MIYLIQKGLEEGLSFTIMESVEKEKDWNRSGSEMARVPPSSILIPAEIKYMCSRKRTRRLTL